MRNVWVRQAVGAGLGSAEHADRPGLRQQLSQWPREALVILGSSFGWEWVCEELEQAGLQPLLASRRKVAAGDF